MIQFLVHEKADSVGVATVDIKAGETAKGIYMDSQEPVEVTVLEDIPLGHKVALKDHANGGSVIKYGEDIGKVDGRHQDRRPRSRTKPQDQKVVAMSNLGTVMGYKRENGRVGVRNHVVILPLDDLSNSACEKVAFGVKGTKAIPPRLRPFAVRRGP